MLLIHGTGASTHSWRDLAPLLSNDFSLVAMDLPGHGFTQRPRSSQLSLAGMTRALAALLDELNVSPDLVVGHSAGAAILAQMCLDQTLSPSRLVSLNGAFIPFRGMAGEIFPRMARLLFVNPLIPSMISRAASKPGRVRKLIAETGSTLDEKGLDLYKRLFRNTGHAAATIGMMANWDLHSLVRRMPALETPLTLVVGENDKAVAPADADEICSMVPNGEVLTLKGVGHLAHEEDPAAVADLLVSPPD